MFRWRSVTMSLVTNATSAISILFLVGILCSTSAANLQLTDDNWDQMLEGEWMIEFYAPWCPACRNLQPVWEDFSSWSKDLGIRVGQVDITDSPGLSGRFMITALPTIYHVKDGVFRQYRSSRTKNDFLMFVEERKWEEIEPISSWQSPASFQMTVVSQFYKLSMMLRNFMNTMTTEYGLPVWGTYLIFGGATICFGLILGLLLVCVIDFVYPPKKLQPLKPQNEQPSTSYTENEDLADEEDEEEPVEETEKGSDEDREDAPPAPEDSEGEHSSSGGSPVPQNKDNVRRRPKKID